MAPHRSQAHHKNKENPMPEAKEVFSEIENRIKSKPEKAAGLNATYQFDLTGESWTLKIADGAATVSPGAAQSPNTTLIASTDDWMNIATGKLNPVQAFMQQKLKVKGDMGLAMKLQGLLQ
ncbi:MAG: SCP2 sterol-binding domain-containing protein [Chloroflexi bacterium]|nr:MAG: SCP2 sterol-binding domain-containing protein [Chloroflexota bacterium]TMF23951.1 MAG: SCP2 sterol-binding domain-containing protein [Chloroflexota bacterium]TMG50007.1 MAG: SCP2 sterol-binding domain-containing protein [Chloroflexota bacterium]